MGTVGREHIKTATWWWQKLHLSRLRIGMFWGEMSTLCLPENILGSVKPSVVPQSREGPSGNSLCQLLQFPCSPGPGNAGSKPPAVVAAFLVPWKELTV